MMNQRKWTGRWLYGKNPPDNVMCFPQLFRAFEPAAYLRTTFELDRAPETARAYVCGLGWHELYVNGRKADDRVLTPVQSQYDKHVMYVTYEIAPLLKPGKNAVAVLLGNGAFNQTDTPWFFQAATWRDYPKLLYKYRKACTKSDRKFFLSLFEKVSRLFRFSQSSLMIYPRLRKVPFLLSLAF